MNDQDIIDTIAEGLRIPGWDTLRADVMERAAVAALDALRNAGYVITKPHPYVVTREALECQPDLLQQIQRRIFGPSNATEADQ